MQQNLNSLPPYPTGTAKMSSLTTRFFANNNRVSTAVLTRKGEFFQVYPVKKFFPSENEWRSYWQQNTTVATRVEVETRPPRASPAKAAKPKKQVKANVKDWMMRPVTKFTAPPGKYYIGDLCYALSDDIYDRIFGLYGYESGLYSHNNGKDFFLVDGTAYGDGCYPSSDGKEFAVDAGIIGICPASLAGKGGDGGHFYTFDSEVRCSFKSGRFTFDSGYNTLVIDTTGDDDAY